MKHFALIAVGFAVFVLYLFTLHPTIAPYRDSGDLIVASATLGIAHPPGYPLYVLAGKSAQLVLPWATAGYRANVFSALAAAGTILLYGACLLYLVEGLPAVLFALLLFSFSPAFWRLAQVSEMYSLNALLAAGILFLAAVIYRRRTGAREGTVPSSYLLALFCGLAGGNHPTVIFLYPALLWLAMRSFGLMPRHYLAAVLLFAAGLSVYLFLPLRSLAHPLLAWGDPTTMNNFLRLVTRSDYGGMRLHPQESVFSWTPVLVLRHLGVYGTTLLQEFTALGALAGLYGIWRKRKEPFFQFLLVSMLIAGPLFIVFSNLPPSEKTTLPILEPHLVLPNLLFTAFIAAGLEGLALPLAVLAGVTAAAFSFLLHFPGCDYRQHFFAYDYGRNVLASTKTGGIIYDPDDPTAFVTGYLQTIEKRRPDVRLAAFFRTRWGYELLKDRHPDILPPYPVASGQELARVLLDWNRARYPVYADLPAKFPPEYLSYPQGMLTRLSGTGEYVPTGMPFEIYRRHAPEQGRRSYDFFTGQILSYSAAGHCNLGLAFANLGKAEAAKDEYYAALSVDPEMPAALNNLGTLAFSQKDYAGAEQWFRIVFAKDPANGSAIYNLALSLKARGNNEEARRLFSDAWENYHSAEAGNELGLALLSKGDNMNAARIFRSVVQSRPDNLAALYNLGLSCRKLGRFADSRRCFEAYLQRTPDPREKEEARALLRQLPAKDRE